MNIRLQRIKNIFWCVICACFLTSCYATYPQDTVEESIKRICRKDYGITNVEIMIKGKTLGVYLPLQELFSLDYQRFLQGETIENLENMVQFKPDALSKIEDVLFSTSRVILSTDRELDFYLLQASDTAITGLQFSMLGYIDDMKRVRFWDISRSEYRKRLLHDLSVNPTVMWKKNIIKLFFDIPEKSLDAVIEEYAYDKDSFAEMSPFFHEQLAEAGKKRNLNYEILTVRAKALRDEDVLVYAQVRETFETPQEYADYNFLFPNGFIGEYLFVLKKTDSGHKIMQVIPFYVIDANGEVQQIELPNSLKIYQNIDAWPKDFDFEEITLQEFIARQMTSRMQTMAAMDERIRTNFTSQSANGKMVCAFEYTARDVADSTQPSADGYFIFYVAMHLRGKLFISGEALDTNEDVRYLLTNILQEFSRVTEAYEYDEYSHIELQFPLIKDALYFTPKDIKRFMNGSLNISDLLLSKKTKNVVLQAR